MSEIKTIKDLVKILSDILDENNCDIFIKCGDNIFSIQGIVKQYDPFRDSLTKDKVLIIT